MAIVGIIVGAWGNTGEVRVQSHTDNPQRFSAGNHLLAEGQTLQIEQCRYHKGMALIKFCGIDSQEDAERLRESTLEVASDGVPSLSPDSYYHFQILDMQVWTSEGELLGLVEDILSTGSNDVYVVRHEKIEILVPALQDVIVDVDVENGRMIVDLPEGLR
jgi:16S rRNA processing protein RimM